MRAAAGERIVRFESECVRDDGLPMPVSLSMSPVAGPGHVPNALVALVRDETERRLAQASLTEVEVRLRGGEALTHVGSWLWDLRTNVVQWSVEFHRIHGIDPLEFGGTLEAYLDVVHPDDRQALAAAIESSVSSARPFEHEYRVPGGEDGEKVVLVRAEPTIGSAATVVGLRGVGQIDHS